MVREDVSSNLAQCLLAPLAQLVEQPPCKRYVVSSNLTGGFLKQAVSLYYKNGGEVYR